MDIEPTVMTKLFYDLKLAQAKRQTGRLVITCSERPDDTWQVFFYLGRIVWATGIRHRLRGWFRVLKQHCPNLLSKEWLRRMSDIAFSACPQDLNDYWEMQILNQAIQSGEITPIQAKAAIHTRVQEVFFSLVDQTKPQTTWVSLKDLPEQVAWLDVEQVIYEAADLCNQWRTTVSQQLDDGAMVLSPDLAPVIKQRERLSAMVTPPIYTSLTTVLDGHSTLWDIALRMQKPLVSLIRSLLPLVRDGLIELKDIPDIKLPKPRLQPLASQEREAEQSNPSGIISSKPDVGLRGGKKGLIACIDDSPLVAKELEAILQPMGYEVLSILDPLQGVSLLLQKKPDLIFLDLVMPSTNGYEFCTFLRKTSAFRDLPIVMLTGHDGVIDRLRAKVTGSSDFLSKPPDPEKVSQVIEKFLGRKTSNSSYSVPELSQDRHLTTRFS